MTAAPVLAILALAAADDVQSPAAWLGFDPAADGAVVDSAQASGYCEHLARTVPGAAFEPLGLSTEGRLLGCLRLGGESGSRPCLLVTSGVHPAEIAAPAAALVLAHRLAAGRTRRARDILDAFVVRIVPCLNPDGTERVARWLRERPPGAGSSLPTLQHRFAGHDLNRDWMLGTQAETRALVRAVHNRHRPWVTIDVHQMGPRGPRLFVPPYAPPVDPAIAPELLAASESLGSRVFDELARSGRRGVARRWTYDAWSPSRAYPFYHGGIRFLIEAAAGELDRPLHVPAETLRVFGGANAAHPDHPLPWTGGRWGLPEAVEALVAALELALEGCLAEPLRAAAARQRNPAGPRDVLRLERGDASPAAADALLRSLQLGGCEVREERGGAWLVGDPEWGSGWCRSLLRCRAYPGRDAPGWEESEAYDTVANDLAHLAGMRATLAAPGSAAAAAPHVPAPPSRPAAMPRAAAVHVLRDAEPDEDEGWLRWVLEEGRVELRSVAAGEIDSLEAGGERRAVLLLPRNALRGRGAVADQVRDFAARGGRVVAWGKSARAAAEASGARLEEVSPPLATPGVLLATVAAPGEARDALLAGLAAPPAVYATGGPLWRPASDPRVATVLRIAADAALCGRLTPAEARGAAGALAVLRIREGDRGGEWILFAFSPHYRGWTEGTMSLLANAIVGR